MEAKEGRFHAVRGIGKAVEGGIRVWPEREGGLTGQKEIINNRESRSDGWSLFREQ